MAKFTEWETQLIYTYAERWKQSLISGDSLLWRGNHIWSQENVESFLETFGSPNPSEEDFISKLKIQLNGKPKGVVQLVCDLLFVYLLFPRKIKLATKVTLLRNVSGFYDGLQIEDNNPALEALENGIGSTGTAYNTRRYYELRYILDIALMILNLPLDERESLLADHFKVRAAIDHLKGKGNPMSRHILLHLLFPDYYERISSQEHKQKIKVIFEKIMDGETITADTDDDIFHIRNKLCALLGNSSIDFYRSPLKECWDSEDSVLKTTALDKILNWKVESQGMTNHKTKYWIYAPGEGSRMWDEFYEKGIMGIGWDEMGSLTEYTSKEAMKEQMKELYGDEYTYRNDALATWQFTKELQTGDVVYAKKGMFKVIGRGIVESEYKYDDARDEYKHIHRVKWTHKGEWDHPGQAVMKTLTEITSYTDYIGKLDALFTDDSTGITIKEKEIEYPDYTYSDFLDEVFIDEEKYDTLVNLLKIKKNIILQGAPGVGKTFVAKRLAYSIMSKKDTSRVMMVQFHQSYSYEDFIMGYRPTEKGFELKLGPFYEFCKKAQDDNERPYFFIIDEINRGNLSKIFGELFMLVEKDKRGEELRLIYSNELFSVPKNLHIIGLMNTADRSLAMIDYALRRRFAFFELTPAFDSEGFISILMEANNYKFNKLITQIKSLNHAISNDEALGVGFRIGHSFFCTDDAISDGWLTEVVKYELIPLLAEYWFDEPAKVTDWAKRLSGALHD